MKEFRQALGHFATGVTIITAQSVEGEAPIGVTANSFTSVSMQPPLILVSLAKSLRSLNIILSASTFAVNVLPREQAHLSSRFARPGEAKWAGVTRDDGLRGTPLVAGRMAHFECRRWANYDGGDHIILVGEVLDYQAQSDSEPLIFYCGSYHRLLPEKAVA